MGDNKWCWYNQVKNKVGHSLQTGRAGSICITETSKSNKPGLRFSRELVDKHLLVPTVCPEYKLSLNDTQEIGNIRFPEEGRMVAKGQMRDLNCTF